MTTSQQGWAAGIAAYLLWGIFPLYFLLFTRTGPVELVAHRVVWTFATALLLLAATRGFTRLRALVRDRRSLGLMCLAGVLITVNWSTYVVAVLTGHTLEAALGYFINPLAVIALGVVCFREQLRPLQRLALVFGALSVVVMVVAYGKVPWIAMLLTLSFGGYSMVKKLVGGVVGPVEGLAVETATVFPVALAVLGWMGVSGALSFAPDAYGLLLASNGVVTAIPLLLFAICAARVPMVGIGILQYLGPIGQFLIGWLLLGEPMPASRWAGFVLVWIAVAAFVVDSVRNAPRRRAARTDTAPRGAAEH